MKVLLTRSVGIRGQGFAAGDVLDLDIDDAKQLVSMNKAVFPAPNEPATFPGPKVISRHNNRNNKKVEEEAAAAAAKAAEEEAAVAVDGGTAVDDGAAGEIASESPLS